MPIDLYCSIAPYTDSNGKTKCPFPNEYGEISECRNIFVINSSSEFVPIHSKAIHVIVCGKPSWDSLDGGYEKALENLRNRCFISRIECLLSQPFLFAYPRTNDASALLEYICHEPPGFSHGEFQSQTYSMGRATVFSLSHKSCPYMQSMTPRPRFLPGILSMTSKLLPISSRGLAESLISTG